ncbi:hypothetical protein [Bacillus cereus]|uniref:hypothetical protein n=1 Tax=Bacillus cereus TaxID=1396 RepID=UPI000BFBDE2F|nr:hypothetical protein [Bacillus cereus]PGR83483.1 hypothetical protein COC63_05725 [Bacillus cereus]
MREEVHEMFNAVADTREEIRTGVIVETEKGLGVVVRRDRNQVKVLVEEFGSFGESQTYAVQSVQVAKNLDKLLEREEELQEHAWRQMELEALAMNIVYEKERSKYAVKQDLQMAGVEVATRMVSLHESTLKLTRLTVHKKLDFEVCTNGADIGDADILAYAEAVGKGLDTSGMCMAKVINDWVVRVPIQPKDVNFGKLHTALDN